MKEWRQFERVDTASQKCCTLALTVYVFDMNSRPLMAIKVVLEVKRDVVDESSGAVGHPGAGGGHPALLPAEHLVQVVLLVKSDVVSD